MSATQTDIRVTPASAVAFSLPGLVCLSILYGVYGIMITFLRILRIGSKRFFKPIDRVAPHKAIDTIFGHHETIKLKSSGISIHYVSKGVPNQPMMLFLHGFPECWFSWRHQMKYFSKNYRVVAIDQRGFGLSSKPQFVRDYKIETLAGDVADVIEQLGYESCILVGHDCGGLIAWATTMLYPHLIENLIIMNAPHPNALRYEMSLNQLQRSWHMFFCQTPFIPEMLFQSDDLGIVRQNFHQRPMGLMNKVLVNDDDIEVFKYTLSQRGTVRAAINFYRALLRYQCDFLQATITAPVLLLWGCQDRLYGEDLAESSRKYCSNIQVKKVVNSSHWVNQDIPEIVNQYMEIFLNERPAQAHIYDF